MLLVVAITAFTGGTYAISQSFAAQTTGNIQFYVYNVANSAHRLAGATVQLAGKNDATGYISTTTCDQGNNTAVTNGSGYALFTNCYVQTHTKGILRYKIMSVSLPGWQLATPGSASHCQLGINSEFVVYSGTTTGVTSFCLAQPPAPVVVTPPSSPPPTQATQPATTTQPATSPPASSTPTAVTTTTKPTNTSTASRTVSRAPAAAPANTSDTDPPSVPADFKATEGAAGSIALSWAASTDNKGVAGYLIERSSDGQNWTTLSDSVTETSYQDSTAAFGAKYTYRLSAKDTSGNGSDYSLIDITTSGFTANALAGKESTVDGEDGFVSVKIPEGALPEDAACKFEINQQDSSIPKGQSLALGVYSFVCKKKDGSQIEQYNKPLEFTVKAEGVKNAKLYLQDGDQWQDSGEQFNGEVMGYSFSTDQPKGFAVVTPSSKKTSWVLLIFGGFLLLLAIFAAVMWLVRKKQQREYETSGYNLDYFDSYMQSADQQGAQVEDTSTPQTLPPAAPQQSGANTVFTPKPHDAPAPQRPAPEIKKMHEKPHTQPKVETPVESTEDDYANKQYPEQPYR